MTNNSSPVLSTVTLTRVTHTVTVTINTTAAADDITSSTVSLISSTDPTWTFGSPAASGSGSTGQTFTFAQVPFGPWRLG